MHFVVEFQDWIEEPKDETISSDVFKRNFESKVENDLEELKKLSEDDYEKNCRHLNYLIDNIRELFFSSKNIRILDVARKYLWDNQIEGNLKKLISSATKYKCQRNRINNPQKDRDLRIKVHDYCDERDKRLKDLTGKGSSENSCYDFMVWVNQNKDSITRDYNNNMSGVRRRAGFFKISNACDLNKFESLFPQMDCSSNIYEKDEVLRGPKDVLEIHQGGDQNTVGQEDLLSGKRKEEKSRDKEKDKVKHKEKKPSDISEEIYGIGRDMSETFVSPKTPVVEEAVREYATNDCVGDTCVVFDCTEGECNFITENKDDVESEEAHEQSSIDSSESYDGFNSLPPEKKKKDEETSVDVSSTKKCEREGCDTEQITKPRSQETERRGKRRNVPLHGSKKGPKNQGKKQLIPKSIDGKGSHGSKNEGTSHSESSTSDKKTRKGRPGHSKKNRGGADSGEGRNRKDKRVKGKHRLTESGDEQLKRRKETISPESPYHMRGDDSLTKDGNDMEDREFSSGNYSDESETNSDSYQGVEGTIEVRQDDDGINSIFGIPFPNFFDYTDFDLSDFSLSNIPYPTIHIPFFPRSPRIYKGLYGGISRVRPNPTHINIDTYKAVDSVSELVNRLRDKADSKEKKRDKPDTCGDVGRDESDRPGEQEDVNRRGNGDKKDEAERTKESKDSTGRHSDTGEGTIRSSDSSDASTEDSSKTSGRKNEDGDLSKGNEIPLISEPREESGENNGSNRVDLEVSPELKDNMVSTSSTCTGLTNDDNYGNGCTVRNNVNSSDSESNTITAHVSGEGKNNPLGTKSSQDLYNGLRDNPEQPVTADFKDSSFIPASQIQEEAVPIPQDGTICDGVIYEVNGSPCTQISNDIDINSPKMGPSFNGGRLSNQIPPIPRFSKVMNSQSLNSSSEQMLSQVLSMNSVEPSEPLFQGTVVAAQKHLSHAQTLSGSMGSGQPNSESKQEKEKVSTSASPTISSPTISSPTISSSTSAVSTSNVRAGDFRTGEFRTGGVRRTEARKRRSVEVKDSIVSNINVRKNNSGYTFVTNKTHQSSSSFFDFSSLTKNISISLAIFGVIFLFIFSNKHSSLGMFNKKKKKRSRKSILIKEDNMNSMMLERYEDIDEEQNEKKNIYEEEHEDDEKDDKLDEDNEKDDKLDDDDEKDDKLNDDDCDDIEFNKSGMILPYGKEEDDVYKIEDQLEWVDNEKIENEKSKYINVERTYDYNNMYDDKHIKSVDVKRRIKEKKEIRKWKTIIEIQMAVIEEIHNEKWEMNKEDFLFICINEFVNDKDRKCLYNKEDDFDSTKVMIKGQNFLWNRWMEIQTYILDKYKEEEPFEYLKNDWKREEDEYMKKIYKELLISLRGDTYYMSQKQKIIWRRWVAKHPYRIGEKNIDEWFDKLFEEINKNGIISDDVIDILLNDYKENVENVQHIYDMIEKRKKLKLILWIQIYMHVWEEVEKDYGIEKKETYVDTLIEHIKDKEYIIDVVQDIKKDIHMLPLNTFSCKWKKEKWFEELKNDWKVEENKRLNCDSLKNNKDIYKELIKKSATYIENNILHELWGDINFKWIDEDNEKDWLKVTENHRKDENNIIYMNKKKNTNIFINKNIKKEENKMKCYEKKCMFGNMSLQGNTEDYHEHNFLDIHKGDDTYNIFNNDLVVEDINRKIKNVSRKKKDINRKQKDESRKKKDINRKKKDINRKNDEIHISLNQHNNEWIQVIKLHLHLIDECKKEEWEKNKYDFLEICIQEYIKNENKDNNSRNFLEDEIFSMDKNTMWDTFIEAHRYILEKWKREEWFHNLKNEWNVEVLNYLNSSENKNDEKSICMIEKEKNIFRKWINKNKEELNDCYEDEKNPFLEEDIKIKKKNYKLIAWIQIHMMILERLKEDECISNKHLFIDVCIELIKKGHLCKNNVIIIQMLNKLKSDMYNSSLYLLSQENDDKKKKEWYKKLKKYWRDKASTYFNFLRQKDNDESIHHIIKQSMINVYDNMFIKNYDDQKFQWIDEDNEKDWLKCVNVKKEEIFNHNICEYKHLKDIKKDEQHETSFLLSNNKTIVEKQQDDDIDISKSELPMCNKILIENKMSILRDIYKTKEILTFYSEEM
ncbi:hypothetical protein PFFCH_00011 [Plasmodium falciparum FCH/4]|uniref:Uncharacterized protein n=2 Tax=Plasmodium falciparum TaxID=5833 RepID=A0A024VV05_PLAFA|nr:hypothetical protein PFFCH_00011 [Plasmodium falciparum FCH/4]